MQTSTQLIQGSWKLYTSHYKKFITIGLIAAAVIFLTSVFVGAGRDTSLTLAFLYLIIVIVMNTLGTVALIKAIAEPDTTTVQSSYTHAKQLLVPFIIVQLLTVLVVFVGTILLIIPGIIAMVYLSFTSFVAVLEGKTGTDALRASYGYIKGRWFTVIGYVIPLALIALALGILIKIGTGDLFRDSKALSTVGFEMLVSVLTTPFFLGYWYLVYREVQKTPLVVPAEAPAQETSSQSEVVAHHEPSQPSTPAQ